MTLQKVEKAEKEEAEAEIVKGKKPALFGGKGRSKAAKGVKTEVLPSPHGIRVKPRTDLLKLVGGEKKPKKVRIRLLRQMRSEIRRIQWLMKSQLMLRCLVTDRPGKSQESGNII